eukprot:m.40421 g.40421  ORF g.40421 m.40421 type:complete len:272 (+) comp32970_c0_seq2:412-1227(+)
MQRDMNDHTQNECAKRKVTCKHCKHKMKCQRLPSHLGTCSSYPVVCPQKCGRCLLRGQIDEHVAASGNCPNTTVNCPFENVGCSFRKERKLVDQHVQKEVVSHLTLAHNSSQRQISELKEKLRSVAFVYCWEITDWSNKMQEAVNGKEVTLYSDRFYIGQPGHRMKVELRYSTSDGIGLFLIPVVGQYDGNVCWPFLRSFSLAVIDQQYGKDSKYTFTRETIEKRHGTALGRPSAVEEQLGLGSSEFVRQAEVDRFVVNNCLLVKVEVYGI